MLSLARKDVKSIFGDASSSVASLAAGVLQSAAMAHARSPRSRLAHSWLGAFALSAVSAGCGGSAPAATAPQTPAEAATVGEAAPDLTEVPEPADLIAIVRWNNPEASVATVQGWTGLPLPVRDLVRELGPAWLGDIAATQAPLEAVATLAPGGATDEPEFRGALSIGLAASLEEARRAALAHGEQLAQLKPGVYRLESSGSRPSCVLAASVGATASRLVCGEKAIDVEQLGPYLTRTLPRLAPPKDDLSAEIRLAPFERRYGATLQQGLRMGASVLPSQFHLGQPRFDRALTDATYGLVEEVTSLTADLDAFSLGFTAQPKAATGSLAFKFRDSKSWVVQTLNDAGARAAAAPPMFWRLPADASSASFSRGASAKQFSAIRKTIATLIDGWLAHEGVKPAEREALIAALGDEYATDAPTVAGSGRYDAATKAAILGKDKGTLTLAFREQIANAGWQLFGVEEPADKWIGALERLVAAYNRAGLQKQVERGLAAIDIDIPAPQMKLASAPKTLPKGSVELTITVHPDARIAATTAPDYDAKKKRYDAKTGPAVQFHAFVMPDAGRTWVAAGGHRETLLARLQAVQASAPESGTIANRAGLERLKNGVYPSAGFMTVDGLLGSVESALAETLPKHGLPQVDLNRIASAMPHAGATPIVFESSVQRGAGGASAWVTGLEVPKQAIEDVVAAVIQIAVGTTVAAASAQ